ncbi:MAG: serine hydrolase domain-containing protein [Chloroflexota bacterium]
MHFLWMLIAMLLLIALPAAAQSADVSALTDQFGELLPALLEAGSVPGAALALIHDGEVVWSQGYGVANLESGVAITPDTPFNVASISKALTSWEIMRMVEAGEIDLDAPANQYLTSWQIPALGRNDPNEATIRRILSHTAGLTVDGYRAYEPGVELPTLPDFLSGGGGADPVQMMISAGRRFMYSGGGYTALQLMIEDLKGEPFAQVMQDDLLTPLGMEHSSFEWSADLNAATDYGRGGAVETHVVHVDQAAGGLYASANDLAAFFSAGMTDDYLTPESIALMHTPVEGTDETYGFGYYVETLPDGSTGVWHDGQGWGARTLFVLMPEQGEGLIILTNLRNGNSVFEDVVCAWDMWVNGVETDLCKAY